MNDTGSAQPCDASCFALLQVFGLFQCLPHGDPCSPAASNDQGWVGLPCRSLPCLLSLHRAHNFSVSSPGPPPRHYRRSIASRSPRRHTRVAKPGMGLSQCLRGNCRGVRPTVAHGTVAPRGNVSCAAFAGGLHNCGASAVGVATWSSPRWVEVPSPEANRPVRR